jgi:hypothetical protein
MYSSFYVLTTWMHTARQSYLNQHLTNTRSQLTQLNRELGNESQRREAAEKSAHMNERYARLEQEWEARKGELLRAREGSRLGSVGGSPSHASSLSPILPVSLVSPIRGGAGGAGGASPTRSVHFDVSRL